MPEPPFGSFFGPGKDSFSICNDAYGESAGSVNVRKAPEFNVATFQCATSTSDGSETAKSYKFACPLLANQDSGWYLKIAYNTNTGYTSASCTPMYQIQYLKIPSGVSNCIKGDGHRVFTPGPTNVNSLQVWAVDASGKRVPVQHLSINKDEGLGDLNRDGGFNGLFPIAKNDNQSELSHTFQQKYTDLEMKTCGTAPIGVDIILYLGTYVA